MRTFMTGAILAILAVPAYAQQPNVNLLSDKPPPTQEEIDKNKAVDQAYKATLSKLPTANAKPDPWQNARDTGIAQKGQTKPGLNSK